MKKIFTVYTQTLENYGSHDSNGRFKEGNHYWKFKGGSTYIVEGLNRVEDAVAFISSIITHNTIHYKEFVCSYLEKYSNSEFDSDNIRINAIDYMNANKQERLNMLSNTNTNDEQLTLPY